ncbi:MAG: TolB family protein [Planctomycetaceae bacterium]
MAQGSAGRYFDSIPPGRKAEPFAPKFFGPLKKLTRFGMAISDDGQECYYAVALNENGRFREEIRFTHFKNGEWAKPRPLLPNEKTYKYVDPHLSPDEKRLYFIYTKPIELRGAPKRQMFDIWYVERRGSGWGQPINIGSPISTNNANEYYVSLTSKGTIYFGSNRASRNNFDLYSARLGADGRYQSPQPLAGKVNTDRYEADIFVSPDESYVVFSSSKRPDGLGQGDLYVSFKSEDGTWSAGINMGKRVNSNRQEFAPSISRDGKYLFFSSGGVIHWVDASVIEDLRKVKRD